MLTVFSLSVLWEWYFLDAHPISLVLYDTLTKSKTTGSSTNCENMMTSNKNRSHEAPRVCLSKSCESYESGHQTVMSSLHITSIYCNVICRLTIRGLNPDSAVEWVSSYTSLPKWTKMVLQLQFFLNLNINNLNIQIMRIIITAVVLSIMVQSFLGDFKLGYDFFYFFLWCCSQYESF